MTRTLPTEQARTMAAARHTAARNLDALAGDYPEHAAGWRHIALGLLIDRDPAMPRSCAELMSEEA